MQNPRLKWKLGKGILNLPRSYAKNLDSTVHSELLSNKGQKKNTARTPAVFCLWWILDTRDVNSFRMRTQSFLLLGKNDKTQHFFFIPGTFRLVAIWITSPRYVICQCTRYFWRWYAIDISQVYCVVFLIMRYRLDIMRIENFCKLQTSPSSPHTATHPNYLRSIQVHAPLWFVHLCVSLSSPEKMHIILAHFSLTKKQPAIFMSLKKEAVLGPQKLMTFHIFSVPFGSRYQQGVKKDISRLEKKIGTACPASCAFLAPVCGRARRSYSNFRSGGILPGMVKKTL